MEREGRYVVFKKTDIKKYLNGTEETRLYDLLSIIDRARANDNRETLECVVVEHDWPEYESTWNAIEQRVDSTIED